MLLNNAVCLSYLFIKFVNHILDMASYNKDKFIPPVTIVSKYVMEKNQCMTKLNVYWKLLTDYEVLMSTLWSRRLSELWWNTCGKLKNREVAAQMCLGQETVWRLRLNKSIVTSTMLFKPRFCFIFCFFRAIAVTFILQYGFATE